MYRLSNFKNYQSTNVNAKSVWNNLKCFDIHVPLKNSDIIFFVKTQIDWNHLEHTFKWSQQALKASKLIVCSVNMLATLSPIALKPVFVSTIYGIYRDTIYKLQFFAMILMILIECFFSMRLFMVIY